LPTSTAFPVSRRFNVAAAVANRSCAVYLPADEEGKRKEKRKKKGEEKTRLPTETSRFLRFAAALNADSVAMPKTS